MKWPLGVAESKEQQTRLQNMDFNRNLCFYAIKLFKKLSPIKCNSIKTIFFKFIIPVSGGHFD
jgi:hypothetical protein